jgi:hypothetical protein
MMKQKSNSFTQTNEGGNFEQQMMRQDFAKMQKLVEILGQENNQLREVL